MIRNLQLINNDGEIIKQQSQTFTDAMTEDGYRIPSHKLGARIFADVQFPRELSDSDIGKMTRLSKLMIGKTNMLGYRKGRNILAYTSQEIGELCGLCGDRGRKFVNKMMRLRLLQRVDIDGKQQYYINPAYFMANGQRLSLDLFLLFKDDLKPIVPAWVMDEFLLQAQQKQV